MRPMLIGVARRIVNDDEEAEDVVQDALLKLWQVRDEVDNLPGMARVIVRHRCLDIIRLCDYFHSDAYTPLVSSEEMDDALEQRYGFYGALIGFNVQYNLSMPGQFKHFDIEPLRFTGEFLIPHDYTITASSRVVHPWAFVATLLLILIPLFLVRRKRKDK